LNSIVNDIHAILEVTVLDEDRNKVYEFLGRIEIPILNVNKKRSTTHLTIPIINFILFKIKKKKDSKQ
jgi:hypothetical protein